MALASSLITDCLFAFFVVSGRRSMVKMRNTLLKLKRKRNVRPKKPGRKRRRKGEPEIQDGAPEVVKLSDQQSMRHLLLPPLRRRIRKSCTPSQSSLRRSRRSRFTRLGRQRSFVNRRWELCKRRLKLRKSSLINFLLYCYATRVLS